MGRENKIKKVILMAFSKSEQNSKVYSCNFCSQSYVLNVTRMTHHLINKCIRCPSTIKKELQSKSRALGLRKIGTRNKEILENKSSSETKSDDDDEDGIPSDSHSQSAASTSRSLQIKLPSDRNLDCFVNSMDKSEEEEIWDLLATACFATNTPLNFTENTHWKKLFKRIVPSLRLPSKHKLSNLLLDKQYLQINNSANQKIANSKTIGIQIGGWNTIRNKSIINVIITTPEPVLFRVIDCKDNCHDATYLCSLLSSIIDELGVYKVLGIVTDNINNMESTWKLMKDKYPCNYFSYYGCCAYIMSLFAQDILKLEIFACLTSDCKAIVKTITKSDILNATFKNIQHEQCILHKSNTIVPLELPSQTKWDSIIYCLESLTVNKINLKELAITETVASILGENIKKNILDDVFWERVHTLHNVLQVIYRIKKNIQTSQPSISLIVDYFEDLNEQLQTACPISEVDEILSHLERWRDKAITPLHLAANLLDPKTMGKNLSDDDYIAALTYISKLSMLLVRGSNIGEVMTDVANYKSKEKLFSKDFIWKALDAGKLDSVTWWKSLCCTTTLSKVATEILNCPSTTCAMEGSFSMFSIVQNNKRNIVISEKAAKLMYVSLNLKLKEMWNLKQFPTSELEHSDSESSTDSDLE